MLNLPLNEHPKKISIVVIGRSLRAIWNYVFDYVIYALVLLKLGYVKGTLVMTSAALLENLIMLRVYHNMKIDWLGYDYVQKMKDWKQTCTGLKQWFGALISRSEPVLFIVLSVFRDAFETTAYFQHMHAYSKWRIRALFVLSVIIGNLYWSAGIELLVNSWLGKIIHWNQ